MIHSKQKREIAMNADTGSEKADASPATLPEARAEISPEYQRARKRVLQLKVFYLHVMVYAAVNALLLVIDALTGPPFWFYWALFGWGIGLAAHAGVLWGMPRVKAWEDKMIEHELTRSHH